MRYVILLVAVALAAGGLAVYLGDPGERDDEDVAGSANTAAIRADADTRLPNEASRPRPEDRPASPDGEPAGGEAPSARDAREDFVALGLGRFVADYFEAAKRGDAEAQFFVSLALRQCEMVRSVMSSAGNLDALRDAYRDAHAECAPVYALELDAGAEAAALMQRAFEEEHPPAVAFTALQIHNQGPAARESAADMLVSAVQSKRPEVFLMAGTVVGGGGTLSESVAWMLVACEYGLDCDASLSEQLTRLGVPVLIDEEGSSILDIMLTEAPGEFDRARARAMELQMLIESEQWEETGLWEAVAREE